MRRSAVAVPLSIAAVVAAGLSVASEAAAAPPAPRKVAAAPAAGTYVPLAAPVRALDTRRAKAVKAGRTVVAKVAGLSSVPTGVGSVVVTLHALSATGSGGLTAYGANAVATATNLQFAKGDRAVSDTAVVPVTRSAITIRNTATTGSVQVVVDVTGYYVGGTPSTTEPGVYRSLPAARRVLDTRSGLQGNRKGLLKAGGRTSVVIGGKLGVPADANAVAATVTVLSPTKAGGLAAWREGDAESSLAALHFAAGQRVSAFTVLGLGSGVTHLLNASKGTVHVVVDVTGYYVGNVSRTAGTLRPVQGARVLSAALGAGRDASVVVGGKGGVPLANVSAVQVTVHAGAPKASGSLQAWKSGTKRPSTTAALYFAKGRTTSNTIMVPVNKGRIALHNTAAGSLGLVVDVHGYVPSNTITAPTAFVGRYPNALSVVTSPEALTANNLKMSNSGTADAASGLVLLDLGAQSISPDDHTKGRTGELDKAHPGVTFALTGTKDTDPVRIRYTDLVPSLQAYVDAFAANGGQGTIAIGTNNDSISDPKQKTYYDPKTSGADWANEVVDKITAPAGVTVVGANDIEAGFRGDQNQALVWENAYLGATAKELIFNGSLDGCASTFGAFTGCNYGWTTQYVKLTTNQGRVQVLPQVYVRNQSVQWANLDKASKGTLRYAGVLTESLDKDSFTPDQGWVAFVRALASVRTTVPAFPVVDIQPDTARE